MLEKLLERIAKTLDSHAIPYMIIGGQAVLIYGEPRLTRDIDITLGVGLESLDKIKLLIKNLELKFLPENIDDFVNKTFVLPALDEESGFRIDFIFSFSPYEKQAMQRVKIVNIGRAVVKFASLEDLVIHKIIAGRPRDIEDVKNVLLKNPDFDKKYVIKWLKQFEQPLDKDLIKELNKILEEIGKI